MKTNYYFKSFLCCCLLLLFVGMQNSLGQGQDCGCMIPEACNFDADAICDDGSCYFGMTDCPEPCNVVPGCMDPAASNFNANANCNIPLLCSYLTAGCSDPDACNYDPEVKVDDGSCDYGILTCPDPCGTIIYGCTDAIACNYNTSATCDDGFCEYQSCTTSGCTNPTACNYDPNAQADDGSCTLPVAACPLPCNVIYGCTQVTACNYNPDATCPDASCLLPNGCNDPAACNFSTNATCNNGTCIYGILGCPDPCISILGCTNPDACNFNTNANCEDGSCITPMGCRDPQACNYNPEAVCDDGSCQYGTQACPDPCDVVLGCRKPTACNYNPLANCEDGTCIVPDGCTDPIACNYDPNAICDSDNCNYGILKCPEPCGAIVGCINQKACNYNPFATCSDASCIFPDGCDDPLACNYNVDAVCDDGTCVYGAVACPDPCGASNGCTDPDACNFDPFANCDDLTCLYGTAACPQPCNVIVGCTQAQACNYNPAATCDNGTCLLPNGCNDPDACNFDSNATCNNGTCDYGLLTCPDPCQTLLGCTNPSACNFSPIATCDDGSCITPMGCRNPEACNYNPEAVCDDGSCIFGIEVCPDACNVIFGCLDINACNFNPLATCNNGSCLQPNGCTDPNACNYDTNATCNNGSCIYGIEICSDPCTAIVGCTNPSACNFSSIATCDDGSCITPAGCLDINACNYNPDAVCDDPGSCLYGIPACPDPCNPIAGCTNANACNFNSFANCDDGSCILPNGCTDPLACNYDTNATCDNGACQYGIPTCSDPCNAIMGCTDANASNYNSTANCEDDSCIYGVAGCTDNTACNYNSDANSDDGSCFYGMTDCPDPCNVIPGCMDPQATNFNADANCNIPLLCVYFESGCTDPDACNYDPDVKVDDGSCDFGIINCPNPCNTIYGCTNPIAGNYNPDANCDDESCILANNGCGVAFEITQPDCGHENGYLTFTSITNDPQGHLFELTTPSGMVFINYTITYPTLDGLGAGDYILNITGLDDCISEIYFTIEDNCPCIPDGCTDADASNYNPDATCDDGSCEYGCNCTTEEYDPVCADGTTYDNACLAECDGITEYTSGACDHNGCGVEFDIVPPACGYENGYLVFTSITNDPQGHLFELTTPSGMVFIDYSLTFPFFDDLGAGDYILNVTGLDDCSSEIHFTIKEDCSCIPDGCTDTNACNFNPFATCDDGSCDFGTTTCPNPCNVVYGCTDQTACNYNPDATCEDDTCTFVSGCTDPTACNYDATATCQDNSCVYGTNNCPIPCNVIYGCTDQAACNYNPDATCEDDTCTFVSGCTDPTACNYDATATCQDNSCVYGTNNCPIPCNVIYGCTDQAACNYNPDATCHDIPSCIYPNGCTDTNACNFNPNATCDDGSCDFGTTTCPNPCNVVYGCTDSEANNYNPDATCEDNSCEEIPDDFPWLVDIIDPTNCCDGTTVYEYIANGYSFVYIEAGEGCDISTQLYFEDGTLYCTSYGTFSCYEFYNLTSFTEVVLFTCDDYPGCQCTDEINPVCGSDGTTYDNACLAECAGVAYTNGNCGSCGVVFNPVNPDCGYNNGYIDFISANTPQGHLFELTTSDGLTYTNYTLSFPEYNDLAPGDYILSVLGLDGCEQTTEFTLTENCPCDCDNNYNPVCGVDGVTYHNQCLATCAGAIIDYNDPCFGGPSDTVYVCQKPNSFATYCPIILDGYKIVSYESNFPTCTVGMEGNCVQYQSFPLPYEDFIEIVVCNEDSTDCYTVLYYIEISEDCLVEEYNCEIQRECTEAITPIILCPEFCAFNGPNANYTLTAIQSFYTLCSISKIDDQCFRYIPLPQMENYDIPDSITVVACNNEICDTILYVVDVGGCDSNPRLIDNNENELANSQFNVYPNPSNGLFYINISTERAEDQTISVLDITGRVLKSYTILEDSPVDNIQVDLTNISSGMYFVEWRTETQHLTERIIIE